MFGRFRSKVKVTTRSSHLEKSLPVINTLRHKEIQLYLAEAFIWMSSRGEKRQMSKAKVCKVE